MSDRLHDYILVTQVPIVLFLVVVNIQAVRAFGNNRFLVAAGGWLCNLLYLSATNIAHLHLGDVGTAAAAGWGAAGDALDIITNYIFWWAWFANTEDVQWRTPVVATIGFLFADLWPFAHLSFGGPRLSFISLNLPAVIAAMVGIASLARFYLTVAAQHAGERRRHKLLLAWGAFLYAGIQPLYLLTYGLPSALTDFGFAAGLVSKALLAFGLVSAFIGAAEVGAMMLDERARARSLAATVGRLTHELGTPIAQMSFHIDGLIESAPSRGTFSKHLEAMENAVLRVNAILHAARQLLPFPDKMLDLKNYSRTFKSIPRFQEENVVSANTLVQLALMAVKETRDEKVFIDVRYSGNCCMRCVPIQITQVMINLLRNAYDAFPAGKGNIELETSNHSGVTGHGNGFIQIRILDDGEGISSEIREKIWSEGFSTRGGPGRGYGLSVVKSIVEQNGGTVTLEAYEKSRTGRGTAATLVFPRVPCGEEKNSNVRVS